MGDQLRSKVAWEIQREPDGGSEWPLRSDREGKTVELADRRALATPVRGG